MAILFWYKRRTRHAEQVFGFIRIARHAGRIAADQEADHIPEQTFLLCLPCRIYYFSSQPDLAGSASFPGAASYERIAGNTIEIYQSGQLSSRPIDYAVTLCIHMAGWPLDGRILEVRKRIQIYRMGLCDCHHAITCWSRKKLLLAGHLSLSVSIRIFSPGAIYCHST